MDKGAWAELFRARTTSQSLLGLPELRLLPRAGFLFLVEHPAQAFGEKLLPPPVPSSSVIHSPSFPCLVSVDLRVLWRHKLRIPKGIPKGTVELQDGNDSPRSQTHTRAASPVLSP